MNSPIKYASFEFYESILDNPYKDHAWETPSGSKVTYRYDTLNEKSHWHEYNSKGTLIHRAIRDGWGCEDWYRDGDDIWGAENNS